MDRRSALAAATAGAFLPWRLAFAQAPSGAAAPGARASTHAQLLERRFLQIAAGNLRLCAEASQLAEGRSNNAAVKELAGALLARERTAQPELLRLLHLRGMAPPMPGAKHNQVLRQLAKLNGVKFDRLYVDEVVTRTYRADIANYEKLAVEAQDPVLKGWVDRQIPMMRFHAAKAARALPDALRGQRAV